MLFVYRYGSYDKEIESLIAKGYYENIIDVDGGFYLILTPDYRNYAEMEADCETQQKPSIIVNAQDNIGNFIIASGNVSEVTQTVNNGINVEDILNLICEMKTVLADISSIDAEDRDKIEDDLDIVREQITSQSPNKTRIKKAVDRLCEIIKTTAALASLVVHSNNLSRLVSDFISASGTSC